MTDSDDTESDDTESDDTEGGRSRGLVIVVAVIVLLGLAALLIALIARSDEEDEPAGTSDLSEEQREALASDLEDEIHAADIFAGDPTASRVDDGTYDVYYGLLEGDVLGAAATGTCEAVADALGSDVENVDSLSGIRVFGPVDVVLAADLSEETACSDGLESDSVSLAGDKFRPESGTAVERLDAAFDSYYEDAYWRPYATGVNADGPTIVVSFDSEAGELTRDPAPWLVGVCHGFTEDVAKGIPGAFSATSIQFADGVTETCEVVAGAIAFTQPG